MLDVLSLHLIPTLARIIENVAFNVRQNLRLKWLKVNK